MRTKMTELIGIRSIPLFVLALLIVLGPAWAARHYPVLGSGEVPLGLTLPVGHNVRLTIAGKLYEGDVTVKMGEPVKGPGGILRFYGVEHTFDFEGGIFNTTGDEIATPTGVEGVYTLSGYMEITGGKGRFEGAYGRLSVHGELNYKTEKILFDVRGAMAL